MNFWIRKYDINIEGLPGKVLWKSVIVVFLCMLILSTILLFLPIQDKLKGDVIIQTKGLPLSILAPSDGFLNLKNFEKTEIKKGDLLATIDTEITAHQLKEIENLLYTELSSMGEFGQSISKKIQEVSTYDIKDLKNELFVLSDLLEQISILKRAANPKDLITTLEKSIRLKNNQISSISRLNETQKEVIQLSQIQLTADSTLVSVGGLSEREFGDTRKEFINQKSVLIENEFRKQQLEGEIIDSEKEIFGLNQAFHSDYEKLRLRLFEQLGAAREQYQLFLNEHILFAPTNGFATVPYDISTNEVVKTGDQILILSHSKDRAIPVSEMYVDAANVGKIKEGMKVRIGLSEFDEKEFGIYYTLVTDISDLKVNGQYRVTLKCELPLETSYKQFLPLRDSYSGKGEILLGRINLLTKISREVYYNKKKYAAL